MNSDALKRAKKKYRQNKIKSMLLELNKETEADLIEHLEKQPNKQGYIKGLIREDMKKEE